MYRKIIFYLGAFLFLTGISQQVHAQCSSLKPAIQVDFDAGNGCGPTAVSYEITYSFFSAQNPNNITIRFRWNDPANNVSEFSVGDPGFVVGGGNTTFSATGSFVYVDNQDCSYEAQAFIVINGVECPSSEQPQFVSSWGRDNQFGAALDINPDEYSICEGEGIPATIFNDASEFNCRIAVEPDAPNQLPRYVQFVYGTNHTNANGIKNVRINTGVGGIVNITDGTGARAANVTRSGVTAAHFGPIEEVPFPANGPTRQSFPVSAVANAANVVGNYVELTMYNWNTCNPWNGSTANPNYADAISETVRINVVDLPSATINYRFSDNSNNPTAQYCPEQGIRLTATGINGADRYRWEIYNGPTAASGIAIDSDGGQRMRKPDNGNNPTSSFGAYENQNFINVDDGFPSSTTPGMKLVRLYVRNTGPDGFCYNLIEGSLEIIQAPAAQIGINGNVAAANTPFEVCYDGSTYDFILTDESTLKNGSTQTTWRVLDRNNSVIYGPVSQNNNATPFDFPEAGNTFSVTDVGHYQVELTNFDNITTCATTDVFDIFVYDLPEATFTASTECAGSTNNTNNTLFQNISGTMQGISPQLNGETITTWEWDFSYDGITFNVERTANNNTSFRRYLNSAGNGVAPSEAGTYDVALRVRTSEGCEDITVTQVTVLPNPVSSFSAEYNGNPYAGEALCPSETLTFTNTSDESLNDVSLSPVSYQLEIQQGASTTIVAIGGENATASYAFPNVSAGALVYTVRLQALGNNGCPIYSAPITVNVSPGAPSNFGITYVSDNNPYDGFANNCSPLELRFTADAATTTLNPDTYTWVIRDGATIINGGGVTQAGNSYDFEFENEFPTISAKNFTVELRPIKGGICIGTSTKIVKINPQPSADFDITLVSENCDEVVYELEATQKGLVTYDWDFNPAPDDLDFTLSGDNNIIRVTYNRPPAAGSNLLPDFILEAENVLGCFSQTITQQPTVPIAKRDDDETIVLTATSATEGCEPNFAVNFSNDTNLGNLPPATTFSLSVRNAANQEVFDAANLSGDLTLVTDFTYTFPTRGFYRVDLIANLPSTCISVSTPPIEVEVNPLPVPAFSTNFTEGCGPLDVQFQDQSTVPSVTGINPTGAVNYRHWTITDISNNVLIEDIPNGGATLNRTLENPNNSGLAFIDYRIDLEVSNTKGCVSPVVSRVVRVFREPEVDFSILGGTSFCQEGYIVEFSIDPEQNPANTTYSFNFGDGTITTPTTSLANQTHTFVNRLGYNGTDSYTVRLTATTPDGCTVTRNRTVTLRPQLDANLVSDKSEGCAPLQVNFTNISLPASNLLQSASWSFREVGTVAWTNFSSGLNNAQHTFVNTSGATKEFEVRLQVTSLQGCTDEFISGNTITVFSSFASGAIVNNNTEVCASEGNVAYQIEPTDVQANSTYTWSISPVVGSSANAFISSGQGTNSIQINYLANAGDLLLQVVEMDDNGCSGVPATLPITVNPLPLGTLNGTTNICRGEITDLVFDLQGTGPFNVIYNEGTTPRSLTGISDGHVLSVSPNSSRNYTLVLIEDLGTGCQNTVNSSAFVNVFNPPSLSVSGNATICRGESANLVFNLGGAGPWDFTYSDGTSTFDVIGVNSSSHVVSVSPTATTTYSLVSITDANTCSNTSLNGSVVVQVNDLPQAVLSGNQAICKGESPELQIEFLAGEAPFRIRYTDGSLIYTLVDVNPDPITNTFFFSPNAPISTVTYTLVDIRDANNPNCFADIPSGLLTGSALVQVNELPTAALSTEENSIATSATICVGDEIPLYFTLTGAGPFSVSYTDGFSTFSDVFDNGDFITVSPLDNTTYTLLEVVDNSTTQCVAQELGEEVNITVNPLPTADFTVLTPTICEGGQTTLRFTFGGNGPWMFSYTDGISTFSRVSFNTTFDEVVQLNAATTFTLTEVSDNNGCTIFPTISRDVNINNLPTALLQGSDLYCQGESVELVMSINGNASSGPWDITYTDGITPNTFTVAREDASFNASTDLYTIRWEVFPAEGVTNYFLVQVIDQSIGCTAVLQGSARIEVFDIPSIQLVNTGAVCAGSEARIVMEIAGGLAPYTVVLSDGSQEYTLNNIQNGDEYLQIIDLTTTFEVVAIHDSRFPSEARCEGSNLGTPVTVPVNQRPQSEISGSQYLCYGDQAVITFTNTGNGPFTIVYTDGSQQFTINNAAAVHEERVSPSINTTYQLVSVSDANNPVCQSNASDISGEAIVEVSQELLPEFTVEDIDGNAIPSNTLILPERRFFFRNTTPSAENWSYRWDFGDGTQRETATNERVNHEYATYGNYQVTLTAYNEFCSEEFTQDIRLVPISPIVDFTYTPEDGCLPLEVQFTNTTQFGDPSKYRWDFGDGSAISTEINPRHIYTRPGVYTVTLSGANPTNEIVVNVKQDIITVSNVPFAGFAVAPTQVFLPDQPIYLRNDSQNATSFSWDFGDGNTSEEYEPTHLYTEAGVFNITLVAINDSGCTDTLTLEAAVTAEEGGQIKVPNIFTPGISSGSGGSGGAGFGDNAVFLPVTDGVVEFELLIYNRWGQLLFESKDKNVGWDGTYNGALCQQDVYVYKLTVKLLSGEILTKLGDVTLLR
ncbi:PKD domain-containing protein [Cytophagales bacterium LB-30]|uniref:PKD domain-containing protein n=1 Tax=Shiella aurantiaca TaxID=3058365 RepID=A0ABT8F478_9BACT|nr:PKD domain-containing protein [Shiella aurantiaca]MDN4165262.1 PKD domain-containing protein [Shiella aurantiaca]